MVFAAITARCRQTVSLIIKRKEATCADLGNDVKAKASAIVSITIGGRYRETLWDGYIGDAHNQRVQTAVTATDSMATEPLL
jgi:hypothetical protein